MKREFTGVFIPAHIWTSNLLPAEKMLLGEIAALSVKSGWCEASRAHFAEWLHCSAPNVSYFIQKLEAAGYLEVCRTPGYRSRLRVKTEAFWVGDVNKVYTGVVNPIDGGSKSHLRGVVNPIDGGSKWGLPEIKDKYNNKRKEESENAPAPLPNNWDTALETKNVECKPLGAAAPGLRDFIVADTITEMIEKIGAFYSTPQGLSEKHKIYSSTIAGQLNEAQRGEITQRFAAYAIEKGYGAGGKQFKDLNSRFFIWWKDQSRFQSNTNSTGSTGNATTAVNPYARHQKIIS